MSKLVLGVALVVLAWGGASAQEHRHGEGAGAHEKAHSASNEDARRGLESIADEVAEVAREPDGPDTLDRNMEELAETQDEQMCPSDNQAEDCDPDLFD